MHIHRIDTFLITENVRVEIIYESNPYFTGDPIVAVIRLRHLGSKQELASLEEKLQKVSFDYIKPTSETTTDNNNSNKPVRHSSIGTESLSPLDKTNNSLTPNEEEATKDKKEINLDHGSGVRSEEIHINEGKQSWTRVRSLLNVFRPSMDSKPSIETKKLSENARQEKILKKLMQYHQPVSLMTGFVQFSGVFQYDSKTIDKEKLQKLNTKIVGINDLSSNILPLNNASAKNNLLNNSIRSININDSVDIDISKYFTSNYDNIVGGLSKANATQSVVDINDISFGTSNMNMEADIKKIPTLLIPQSLLFTELTLEAEEIKVFKFTTDPLPMDMCPTYTKSNVLSISYTLDFGVTQFNRSNNKMEKFNVNVPINVGPYVDTSGKEFLCKIDREPIIMESATIKPIIMNTNNSNSTDLSNNSKHKRSIIQRNFSISSTLSGSHSPSLTRRTSSIISNKDFNVGNLEKLRKNFIELCENNSDNSKHIEELVEEQIEFQFNSNEIVVNENLNSFRSKKKKTTTVRDNLANISVQKVRKSSDVSSSKVENEQELIPQLDDLKKIYKINKNGEELAVLRLGKEFFKNSEDIDLILEFNKKFLVNYRITGTNVTLNMVEVLNSKFTTESFKNSQKKGKQNFSQQISEYNAISFDESENIPIKLIIPRTPMNQICSQFSSDIFNIKLVLRIKLIIIKKDEEFLMVKQFEDKSGVLNHSNEYLDGEEFICSIPIPFLPSDHAFGGW